MMTARIAGIGAYVPENLITNDDLAKIVDTNDEWIRTRTGIRERRISSGEGTRHLAAKAAERALAAAGPGRAGYHHSWDFIPGPELSQRCLQCSGGHRGSECSCLRYLGGMRRIYFRHEYRGRIF